MTFGSDNWPHVCLIMVAAQWDLCRYSSYIGGFVRFHVLLVCAFVVLRDFASILVFNSLELFAVLSRMPRFPTTPASCELRAGDIRSARAISSRTGCTSLTAISPATSSSVSTSSSFHGRSDHALNVRLHRCHVSSWRWWRGSYSRFHL